VDSQTGVAMGNFGSAYEKLDSFSLAGSMNLHLHEYFKINDEGLITRIYEISKSFPGYFDIWAMLMS